MEIKRTKRSFAIFDDDKTLMGEIIYEANEGCMVAVKTFVDPLHRGKGLAKILVDTLLLSEKKPYEIIPQCSYVLKTFVENQEYKDVWEQDPRKQQASCRI
jgi:predicted GNAT family acetyltransferase